MAIHFEIPKNIEEQLRSSGIDPTQTAKELLFVNLYRKEQITHHQLAEALGLDRDETDGVLKRHGVEIELSREEFRSQVGVAAPSLRKPTVVCWAQCRGTGLPERRSPFHPFDSPWTRYLAQC